MVVMNANPLDNIRNTTSIAYTVINGRVYDNHMNEVGRRNKPRQPFWFASGDSEAASPGVSVTAGHSHGHD